MCGESKVSGHFHLQTPGLLCESVVVGGDPVLDDACLQQLRHCYVAVVGLKLPSFYIELRTN